MIAFERCRRSHGNVNRKAASLVSFEFKFEVYTSDAGQALLAEVVRRQREIESDRAKMRTMVKPAELREAQERVKGEVEEVTLVCKRVKTKLDELDTINAQLLSEEQARHIDTLFPYEAASVRSGVHFGQGSFCQLLPGSLPVILPACIFTRIECHFAAK